MVSGPLISAARADFSLGGDSLEDLMTVALDVIVALSFRMGMTPGEVVEVLWKTLATDPEWKGLLEAHRLGVDRG